MAGRLTILILLVMMVLTTYSQEVSKEDADSLLKSLSEGRSEADQLDIFLMLAKYYIFKAGEEKVDFDSARECMRKAAYLNNKIKSADAEAIQILLQSQIARENGQIKEGKAMAETAVKRLGNSKNKYYSANAYFLLSEYYSWGNLNESAEKRRLVELAIQSYEHTKYKEQLAFCLKHLADLYALNDEREKAVKMLDRSLQIYKSIGYTSLQGVYILYSYIYYQEGDYKHALNYGLMALKNAQIRGDSSMSLCQINNYIGKTLFRLNENEKAIGYYREAMKVAIKYNDNEALLQVMANTVDSYIALKKPYEALVLMGTLPKKNLEPTLDESYIYTPLSYLKIYNELRDYKEMQSYSNQILQLNRIHKPQDKLLNDFYRIMIGYYLHARQYNSAETYTRAIDSLSQKIGDPHRVKEDYYLKFRLDTARGEYKSAAGNLLKYQALNDSLFNEASGRQIRQLEVEFETEKNKNEITVLNQKNQLQQNHLKQARLVKNFTIGGIVFLFIIIGLLYRQFRHKQQSNKIILQKNQQLQLYLNEKEWLVKEIHHRVKNNFHVVASLLEIQSSYLKNKEAYSAIKESQHRIHSMSIIHQKLYQSATLSTIRMPEYIYELVEYLRESYAIRDSIGFSLQVENIELDDASGLTLGLILNEAITNSIKYAFTDTMDGKITISLSYISDSQIMLGISDNGRGLPTDFETRTGTTMGMEMLQGLTDDLGGSYSIETNGGTHIKIIFDYKPIAAANVSFS
ncbi:tetratricopeptide repeat-containing sensor histidine kinase [Flavihumibacter solisilvae]|uniref:histidine kinase n=1 Tax=Flavihumibacter solisilvae TaxID=1349421 RepID=A0A0C1IQ67_9BACT|nr:sensor histidine kinase [Flavihumibacter solisilvae]KIC92604.1 hypothetical protein OI18_21955 [Flavihumibacter solisilvae]